MNALRMGVVLLISAVLISGAACRSGYGSLCALGEGRLGVICPLGFLGTVFASKSLQPGLWIAAGSGVLLIVLFGRFFCAWVCPGSLLRSLKARMGRLALRWPRSHVQAARTPKISAAGGPSSSQAPLDKRGFYSSLAVLAGALASSYIFGFPVFCLVCPVGLAFGTVFALVRLFSGAPAGFELLFFPLILFAEFFLFRSWCSSFCPLGALHGLLGGLSRLLRVRVDEKQCLASQGVGCRACEKACPQGINLGKLQAPPDPQVCTKCLECYEKCPVKAVQVKLA